MNNKGEILLVDDDRAFLALLSKTLTNEGCSVRTAESGEAALAAVALKAPELIFLDIRMPGMDGFEVIKRLKARPETSGIPVIFLSAIDERPERVEGLKLGAVDYFSKSFHHEELLYKMRTHTELYRLRAKCEQQTLAISRERDQLKESEARFRGFFENLPMGMVFYKPSEDGQDFIILDFNPEAERLESVPKKDMIGKKLTEVFPGVKELGLLEVMRQTAADGKPRTLTSAYYKDDKRRGWRENTVCRLPDGQLTAVYRDTTEMEEAHLVLRESEERYRAVAEYSNNAICILDAQGRFLWLNDQVVSVGGYSREEYLAADSFARFLAPESAGLVLPNFQKAVTGLPYEHDYPAFFLRADGQKRLGEIYITDYKDKQGRINLVVRILDITERVQADADRERLTKAIEQTSEIVIITDITGNIQYVNPAFETVTGYSWQEVNGKSPRLLRSGKQDEAFYRGLWTAISSGKTWTGRLVNKRKDGTLFTEESTISAVKNPDGKIVNYVAVTKDITEQLRLEGQFYQAQKMEAVGLLAGGIAHDFNNILTAIKGYCGMVTNALKPEDPNREDMNEIMSAADRASTLTRQLLAFSRRQIIDPKVTDLNKTFNDMTKMLGRIIGENVKLSTKFCSAPCFVLVDPGLIEQVAMNLVVNARDALSNSGKITLETEVLLPPDEFFAARPTFARGRVVSVKVGDNGSGMSPEVKKHLFEPFYTTKAQGKGTGLGLSMVYGTVKQSGGDIVVESEQGKGTVFNLYFPLAAVGPVETSGGKVPEGPKKGTETVLFVEDDDSLRRLGERQLRASGYTVISAGGGKEALEAAERHGKPVDLLMTDVVMPGMSGRELAAELVRRKRVARTLFMSGYTDDSMVKHGVLEPGIAFLYKPFTFEELSVKIREVLDGPADQARA